ncbi:hypothetical protein GCM10009104_19730 [Marinobacterium maritimum]|uniref:Uncharacterized protein n=1 Tax=Marinobacterium maritimum TaxID=500162 RepID=A0ABN1I6K1_9GAMM
MELGAGGGLKTRMIADVMYKADRNDTLKLKLETAFGKACEVMQ